MINKYIKKGQHQFHFTKGDIPAGVYQLVFEVDGLAVKAAVFICCDGFGWLEIKNQLKLGLKLVLVIMLSVV